LLDQLEARAAPWLDRVAAIEPLVEKHRHDIEAQRRIPEPLYEAMRDADLFRMRLPRQ
jgi:hypothetical protein